ncbi:MAG: hypothetical protein OHK0029_40300 [Armatimonadaceae bacterium]
MQKNLPATIARVQGLRGLVLRHTKSVWHDIPKTNSLQIPEFYVSAKQLANLNLHPSDVRSEEVGFQKARGFCWVTVQEMFIAQPCTSNNLCELPTKTHIIPVPNFFVSILSIPKFKATVFGKIYRSIKSPSESLFDRFPSPIPIISGTEDEKDKPQFLQPNRKATEKHPYEHLYGLLYPPTEAFMAEQIPQSAELRPYQKVGVEFLVNQPHALLADDMGLGKTAQCSVALAVLRRTERVGRTLIICPKALIHQWIAEAERWGGIYAHPVRGNPTERKYIWEDQSPRVLVTTPNLVQRDASQLTDTNFDLVICDDVGTLKNPNSQTTRTIRAIKRNRSWCLSGTPMENKPEDLLNVMEFVKPKLFNSLERQNIPNTSEVQNRIKPYFLRRRKKDILKDLPEKINVGPISLELEGKQEKAYRDLEKLEWSELQKQNIQINKIHIFSIISKLLHLCNHYEQESTKADIVEDRLEEVFSEDSETKCVLFSRWTKTLDYLDKRYKRFSPLVYHGSLSETARRNVLKSFSVEKQRRLLMISTKAGARGLNLQHANYVFHFDRTWNPVDEMQAEDRCWRLGQKKNVFVYRFIAKDTIEERVHEVLSKKQRDFIKYVDSMSEDTDALVEVEWTIEELVGLLKPREIQNEVARNSANDSIGV